jgi:hypothetical protein
MQFATAVLFTEIARLPAERVVLIAEGRAVALATREVVDIRAPSPHLVMNASLKATWAEVEESSCLLGCLKRTLDAESTLVLLLRNRTVPWFRRPHRQGDCACLNGVSLDVPPLRSWQHPSLSWLPKRTRRHIVTVPRLSTGSFIGTSRFSVGIPSASSPTRGSPIVIACTEATSLRFATTSSVWGLLPH